MNYLMLQRKLSPKLYESLSCTFIMEVIIRCNYTMRDEEKKGASRKKVFYRGGGGDGGGGGGQLN